MTDFSLTPDVFEDDTPTRPLRSVATGLAPTSEAPRSRRTQESSPCYGPCEACGTQVLTGVIASGARAGQRVAVDTSMTRLPVWVVIFDNGAPVPRLVDSQGYPEHRCRASFS